MIFQTMLSNNRGQRAGALTAVFSTLQLRFSSRSDASRDQATPHSAIANASDTANALHLPLPVNSTNSVQTERKTTDRQQH